MKHQVLQHNGVHMLNKKAYRLKWVRVIVGMKGHIMVDITYAE